MTCTDMRVLEFVFEEELSERVCSAWYALWGRSSYEMPGVGRGL